MVFHRFDLQRGFPRMLLAGLILALEVRLVMTEEQFQMDSLDMAGTPTEDSDEAKLKYVNEGRQSEERCEVGGDCTSDTDINGDDLVHLNDKHWVNEMSDGSDVGEGNTDAAMDKSPESSDQPKTETKIPPALWEFPSLTRIDPGEIGHVEEVELIPGTVHQRITRSVSPPIFEIPNFLSDEECDAIIQKAGDKGMIISNLFGDDVEKELEEKKEELAEVSRISEQAWIPQPELEKVFNISLQKRVAKLTQLSEELIMRSEHIQVVSYTVGGHYHAHIDTLDNDVLPCCFQTYCGERENTPEWNQCCRLCRYITVLYYLNDVERGGETAFPLAGMNQREAKEKTDTSHEDKWHNLSYHCYNASLVVKPKKGTAIMWYNHLMDEQTGYLGKADLRTHHGGCDILKGAKWIANNWISATTYEDRFKSSVFYQHP